MDVVTKPGPTETRVRAALLRLWGRHVAEYPNDREYSWPAYEVLAAGRESDTWHVSIEAIQRVGLRVAKSGHWSELGEGIEYTYERGTFRVRKRQQVKRPEPDEHRFTLVVTLRESSSGDLLHALDDAYNHGYLPSDMSWREAEPASVEPRVTQRHLDMMRHATGGKLRGFRNYYCAEPGTDDHAGWCELVDMGLAGPGDMCDWDERDKREALAAKCDAVVFHVTEAGFRMTYGDVRKPAKRGRRG